MNPNGGKLDPCPRNSVERHCTQGVGVVVGSGCRCMCTICVENNLSKTNFQLRQKAAVMKDVTAPLLFFSPSHHDLTATTELSITPPQSHYPSIITTYLGHIIPTCHMHFTELDNVKLVCPARVITSIGDD